MKALVSVPENTLIIPAAARKLAAASISANTHRIYAGVLHKLDAWLAGRRLDDAALAVYLSELFEAGLSPSTAGQTTAAARFRAKLTRSLPAKPIQSDRPPRECSPASGARARAGGSDGQS